jgi:hypothetical protein
LSGSLFCFVIAIVAKEIPMPLFSPRSHRSRAVRRHQVGRSDNRWSRPETLERRTMLTGNDPAVADATDGVDFTEPPAIVTAVGVGLDTFASAEAYADWLVGQATDRWQSLFGKPAYYDWPWWYRGDYLDDQPELRVSFGEDLARPDSVGGSLGMLATGTGVESADSSTTNTQIAGVDEADLVEVDGDTLYSLARNRLSIVRGFADAAPELASQIDLAANGRVAGMYLFGDRLTIVSQDTEMTIAGRTASRFPLIYPPVLGRAQTIVTVLDVSDLSDVSVANRTTFDGGLVSSRMVEGQLRLVLNHRLELPRPQVIPYEPVEELMVGPSARNEMPEPATLGGRFASLLWWPDIPEPTGRYETAEAYASRVRQELVEAMTPQVYQVDAAGNPLDVSTLIEPTAIDVPEPGAVRQLTTITAFDVTDGQPQPVTTGVFTRGTVEVFATAEDLYVFDGHQSHEPSIGLIDIRRWQPPVTTVTKVGFAADQSGAATVSLVSQGTITGRMLNQFAADAQNGFLRVVVEVPGEGSGVRVLEQQSENLVEVGSITGFAPREDLYSVRFVGNRAYFVTFRRTDPLFVVDLSNPTAPTLLGELKVPGFSDHIQPLDENHLLTIGRDADDETGRFKGMQVSIFDVTEPGSPSLLHRYTLAGGRGTSTAITGSRWRRGDGDHLALGFFPDEGVITIPVTTDGRFEWDLPIDPPIALPMIRPLADILIGDDSILLPEPSAWKPPTQRLEVLSFDLAAGISSLGAIDHDTSVDRAVKITGQLVGVSASEVSVHSFTDPATTLGSVRLDEASAQPITELPAAEPQAFPAIEALIEQAVAGLPVHRTWVAKTAETVGDRTVVFAEHASGVVHRLTSSGLVAEKGWAAFGFDGIGNLESMPLSRQARGESFADAVAEVRGLLSDAVLQRLDLSRDADGRLQSRGPFFA